MIKASYDESTQILTLSATKKEWLMSDGVARRLSSTLSTLNTAVPYVRYILTLGGVDNRMISISRVTKNEIQTVQLFNTFTLRLTYSEQYSSFQTTEEGTKSERYEVVEVRTGDRNKVKGVRIELGEMKAWFV